MPPTRHLLIPLAASTAAGCLQALQALQLPRLDRLLSLLTPTDTDTGEETDYAPPHERALARALGLPQEATPWAAWQRAPRDGAACAWLTPCHWQAGADHVSMLHPAALQLDEADAQALLAILAPWFAQDGIALAAEAPTRWRAQGEVFDGLACAALDRVIGRDVRAWMPRGPRAQQLRRLHSEVQMLLYTHPWSEARAARGRLAVSAFWLHGAGRLPHPLPPPAAAPEMPMALYDAALLQDWAAWARAWRQLDEGAVAALLRHVQQGGDARLTLCGERSALAFAATHRGLNQKIIRLFRPLRFADVREQL